MVVWISKGHRYLIFISCSLWQLKNWKPHCKICNVNELLTDIFYCLQICNAVAVAGFLNATLVIPNFHYHSIWRDPRSLSFCYAWCWLWSLILLLGSCTPYYSLYIVFLYHGIWLGLIKLNLSLLINVLNNKNDTVITLHVILYDICKFIKDGFYTTSY
jgi:hypothetical protein